MPARRINVSSGRTLEQVAQYSRALRVGDTVLQAGTTAIDRAGHIRGVGDIYRQTRSTLDTIFQALAEAGVTLRGQFTANEPSSLLLGRAGLGQLLARHPDLDAVYFSNDDMAVGGLMHCMAAGIAVPERLALTGFNGLEIGEAVPQRLTTIRSPRYRIGQLAAEHILARLAGGTPPRSEDIGCEFIMGQTA